MSTISVDCFWVTTPLLFDLLWQLGFGDRHAVFYKNLRGIQIGADIKGHGQRIRPIACAGTRHVEHAFDAVDLLFDWLSDGFGKDLCIGPGIGGDHLHGGWRNLRILFDRQSHQGDDT